MAMNQKSNPYNADSQAQKDSYDIHENTKLVKVIIFVICLIYHYELI